MGISLTESPVFGHYFCCLTGESLDYIFCAKLRSVVFSPLLFTGCFVLSSPSKRHTFSKSKKNYSEIADNFFYCSVWLTQMYVVCSHVFLLQAPIWLFFSNKDKFPASPGSGCTSTLVSCLMHNSCSATKPAERPFLFSCANCSHGICRYFELQVSHLSS